MDAGHRAIRIRWRGSFEPTQVVRSMIQLQMPSAAELRALGT
jgi:hypothetical protein